MNVQTERKLSGTFDVSYTLSVCEIPMPFGRTSDGIRHSLQSPRRLDCLVMSFAFFCIKHCWCVNRNLIGYIKTNHFNIHLEFSEKSPYFIRKHSYYSPAFSCIPVYCVEGDVQRQLSRITRSNSQS